MRFLTLFLSSLTLAAAGPAEHRPPGNFRPAEATRVLLVPPLGVVGLIAQGNRPRLDPDASVDAAELLRQALYRHSEKLQLEGEAKASDSLTQRRRCQQLGQIFGYMQRKPRVPIVAQQPWLDSLLAPHGQRYALLSCVSGYTRTAANSRSRLAKDIGISLLSLGTLMVVSSAANTRVAVAIYDGAQHQLVYYKDGWPTEKDPLEGVVIDRQLTDLLAKDFKLTDRI